MISTIEMEEVMLARIPDLVMLPGPSGNVYELAAGLARLTRESLQSGNLQLVKNCMETADYLMQEGTQQVKQAVEKVFVFSVGLFLDMTGAVSRQMKETFPLTIRQALQKQMKASYP